MAVVRGWVSGITEYLAGNDLAWDRVGGVGLAIPGTFQRYGVFDKSPNLPESFAGFDVHTRAGALAGARDLPCRSWSGTTGTWVAWPRRREFAGHSTSAVLMLAPGSGLGCAYIDPRGLPLDGDTLAGMEGAHMPAPLHLLNAKPYPCGCGRTWGCVEVYTTLSGLPHLLAERIGDSIAPAELKQRAFGLRGLAQKGDALACEIFDFQARALGLHVATLAMAVDPAFVVIGGGLMDPEATTEPFRERYLRIVREAADPYLWPAQLGG